MVDSSLVVAFVALAVSLIAMLVALGQLAGQLLGTAEGYRRCNYSVIGGWAAYTHRKWHWVGHIEVNSGVWRERSLRADSEHRKSSDSRRSSPHHHLPL